MDRKKAILLDKILMKFRGNATLKWADIQNGAWNDIASYDDCENNINFLVGDGMLRRDNTMHTLCTTDKGFATMTDLKNLGYVTKAKKELLDSRIKYMAFGLATGTFLILFFNNFIKPNLQHNSSTDEVVNEALPSLEIKSSDSTIKLQKDTVVNRIQTPK